MTIDTISIGYNNRLNNFTQNSLCLNEENNFTNHLIPSKLDFGESYSDCPLFCHLYLQLRLEKPLKIHLNSACRHKLGSLKTNSLNKDMIEFVRNSDSGHIMNFNQSMCQPYKYYSCNYSMKYSLLKIVDGKPAVLSLEDSSIDTSDMNIFIYLLVFTIIVFATCTVFNCFQKMKHKK